MAEALKNKCMYILVIRERILSNYSQLGIGINGYLEK